ncbi:MAG: Gfo/Idh/MocA family protein [Brotaphodocola sp.]
MKIGIAGAGTIVPVFLQAQKNIGEFHIQAICATKNSREKLMGLAQEYGIETIYDSYTEMVSDPSIDCIYVAVPNHLHASFCRQALEHEKSVICEKPFCSNLKEALELTALAERKKQFLFEAISNQYLPNYEKVRELLPRLGRIRIAELNFSKYSRRYDAFKRGELPAVFDPEKSGGALMDLNVYNIHFITGLFGEPQAVQYYANRERGVDTSGILILTYPDFQCVSIAAKDCQTSFSIKIQGEQGCIHSECASNSFQHFSLSEKNGSVEHYALNQEENRLYYELRAFADMVKTQDRERNRQNLNHTLMVQKILDAARK